MHDGERNSKMTDQRTEAILLALRHGCTRRAAAGAAGINTATFYRWLEDATLRDAVEKAEAEAEATFTGIVAQASVTSWQAAAWWLERRKYTDFGRHDRVDVTVDAKAEASKLAESLGIDADAVMAEAEAILAGGKR